MSVHTDDASVSVASVISSMAEVLHGDERSKLIKGVVDVPMQCWPYSFVVSSTNSYVDQGHKPSLTSRSWSLVFLDLFLQTSMISTLLPDLRLLVSLMNSMQWTS